MLDRLLAALVAVPFAVGAAAQPDERADAEVAFTFQDEQIVESSGLAVAGGLVVTTNDSGDSGRVFAVDPDTGETVGTTGWAAEPTDVEALAPGSDGGVWVGDIGDNLEQRDSVQVAPVPVGHGNAHVRTDVYDLVYPDGPHDAETLMSDPAGRLYVATKSPLGGTLYAAPERLDQDRPNRLEPLGDVLPLATDGAFLDAGRFVVRNYAVAAVYAFPSLERLAQVRLPPQEQGEGLAVDADGSLLLSSEGVRQDVLRIAVPEPEPTATPTATPTTTGSAPPATESREDRELPGSTDAERDAWPWLLGGVVGLGVLVVLGFSLRRR